VLSRTVAGDSHNGGQRPRVLNLPGELLIAGKVFSYDCFLSSMERQRNNWRNRLSSVFLLNVADAADRPCPLF
jgi:hypothetical protein